VLTCVAARLTLASARKRLLDATPMNFFDAYKEVILAKDDPKTAIDPNGLRYRSKVAGSPFSATGAFGAATMSCFLCGKHRPRAQLKTRKLLGKAQAVCAPSCKELDELLRSSS